MRASSGLHRGRHLVRAGDGGILYERATIDGAGFATDEDATSWATPWRCRGSWSLGGPDRAAAAGAARHLAVATGAGPQQELTMASAPELQRAPTALARTTSMSPGAPPAAQATY